MKILIFLLRWKGGVGTVVNSVKKELEKRGHEVICISREDDLRFFSSKNVLRLRKKYIDVINKESPDVIYTQDWSMALPLVFPFRLYKQKHFCCFHGNQLGKTNLLQKVIGLILGQKLIVVGDSLRGRFPASNKIYNGVDLNSFYDLKRKRDCLGWVKKDTEVLTEKDILLLSKSLKLKPLIAKDYEIPFEMMNEKFYNRCKVFVSFPPKSAGFNLVWIEAMASGVPIVIGNNEGIGCKLKIYKFSEKEDVLKNIEGLHENNYREDSCFSYLTWEHNVPKLLNIWSKN